jgi:acyl-CoA reductase-like NAD-dependent aldehyde dehydrogenase
VIELPGIRWGKPYESLDTQEVVHFETGEPLAKISQCNGGIVSRDLRLASKARAALKKFSCNELIDMVAKAADMFEHQTLTVGNTEQSADDFIKTQSATTGLPEHMCRKNMAKNCFVLRNMREILDALTRGLDLDILTQGYGDEGRGVTLSYQVQSPVLGAVLPNNSPGVHTLWMPVIPLQVGLVLKPGTQEPWTAYRTFAAFKKAGVPAEAISLYPGGHDAGQAIMNGCGRSMIFGSQKTVDQFSGNPRVQVHGPGFSKILLGDDVVDRWEEYLDVMVESVYINGGRSCINCSGIWASRHTREIAEAIAEKLGPIEPLRADDPEAGLAAFTVQGMGKAVWEMVEQDLKESGVDHLTEPFGPRLIEHSACSYLRPVVVHCDSPKRAVASKEFMFPFVSVVQCPQEQMISSIGPTLVGTVITENQKWIEELIDTTHIDRLNVGPIPTNRLDWLQPHEGNLIDFLFRSRAFQVAKEPIAVA